MPAYEKIKKMLRLGVAVLCAFCAAANAVAMVQLETPAAGERVLVIAPHIDDEGLAAAGYVNDAVAAGAEVFVVYVTAGDHSRTALAANRLTFFATAALNRKGLRRLREGRIAAQAIGLKDSNLMLLGYPDRGLHRMLRWPDRAIRSASTGKKAVPYRDARSPGAPYRLDSLLSDLESVLQEIVPDVVIAPDDQDHHPDHRTAAVLLSRVLKKLGLTPERLGYVIHTRGPRVRRADRERVVYPLSAETQRKKREMLADYRSQRRSPYLRRLFARSWGRPEIFVRYRATLTQ